MTPELETRMNFRRGKVIEMASRIILLASVILVLVFLLSVFSILKKHDYRIITSDGITVVLYNKRCFPKPDFVKCGNQRYYNVRSFEEIR